MDITGYSTDFVVDSTFPVGLKRFVLRQQERWPGLYLYGEPSSSIQLADWQPPVAVGEDYSEIITFSSGEAMESFWEENGYTLNAEGEGPVSVFYANRPHALLAGEVRNVECAEAGSAQSVEGVGLLLSEYFAVSLVTPDDPSTDAFSGQILRDFLASFGIDRRPR